MKLAHFGSAMLVCLMFAACAGEQGQRFESSLSFSQASNMLRDENVVPANRAYAIRQLNRLADQGDTRALNFLSAGYLRGRNGLPQDDVRAAQYFELGREEGDMSATRTLIRLYSDSESAAYDPERVVELLTAEFEGGDEAAGLKLMNFLTEQGQIEQAQAVQTALIAGGNMRAQRVRAASLLDETNPDYNPARAIDLYEELAAQGDAEALRQLGRIYLRGMGVEQDRARAVAYLERSLAAGNNRAGLTIASLRLNPRTEIYDEQSGYALLEDLAAQGEAGAWVQLARRSPDRYVRTMQDLLRAQGVYQAPSTGQIDPATIQALVEWCPANDVPGDCTLDPFSRDVSRALARAARRAQS